MSIPRWFFRITITHPGISRQRFPLFVVGLQRSLKVALPGTVVWPQVAATREGLLGKRALHFAMCPNESLRDPSPASSVESMRQHYNSSESFSECSALQTDRLSLPQCHWIIRPFAINRRHRQHHATLNNKSFKRELSGTTLQHLCRLNHDSIPDHSSVEFHPGFCRDIQRLLPKVPMKNAVPKTVNMDIKIHRYVI